MRVLITGANGFLGRHVVAAVAEQGHEVAAMVRPARYIAPNLFPHGVDVVRGDLRVRATLPAALEGVDAVIHLAACVVGDDDSQFASTVVGTENLLEAMREAGVERLVHCGTFSVYDWRRARSPLDDESPLEDDLYQRDGYAISKTWQERLVRRFAKQTGCQLTILRPGFLWGDEHEEVSGVGHSFGPLHLVFGGMRKLPLTYVENCATLFAAALNTPKSIGETYNVVDEPQVSAWRYQGDFLRATAARGWRIYVPYWMGIGAAHVATWTSKWWYSGKGTLPGILMPSRFRARFRPIRFSTTKLRKQFPKSPAYSYKESWKRTRQPAESSEQSDLVTREARTCG